MHPAALAGGGAHGGPCRFHFPMIPYFIVCSTKAPFTNCSTIILLLSYPNYLISRSEKGVGDGGGVPVNEPWFVPRPPFICHYITPGRTAICHS